MHRKARNILLIEYITEVTRQFHIISVAFHTSLQRGCRELNPEKGVRAQPCFGMDNTSELSTRAEHGSLRGRGVLGNGLGAIGHGVLGKLSREGEAHSNLDLVRGEGALLVVAHELAGFVGDLVKDVRDEPTSS